MKKLISLLLCLTLAALCGCADGGEAVNVQSVAMLASTGSMGMVERCAGKVVSGQTARVNKDADKKILEVAVKEGDMVKEGDLLFSYDAAAMELSLEKLRLELKTMENTITSAEKEIEELEKQKKSVWVGEQLSYTLQIDSKQADIREAEYNKAIQEREIAAMEKALEATDVFAPIGGRIMSVAEEGEQQQGGSASAFITIMDISSYQVQGNINELNLYDLTEGMGVLVRSRMDETQIWHGVIISIDWENPVLGNDTGMYYGVTDDMTSTSKYPFYAELESIEGLTLGQHVIIEPDYGQEALPAGLWLPTSFVANLDSAPYVWAQNEKQKLEKRSVTVGEVREELGLVNISEGLELSDFIAVPEDGLTAGRPCSEYTGQSFPEEEYGYEEGFFATDGDYGYEEGFFATDGDYGFDEGFFATDGDALPDVTEPRTAPAPVPGKVVG